MSWARELFPREHGQIDGPAVFLQDWRAAAQRQLDSEILKRWSMLLDVKEINEVDIETFGGKTARCKTKVITDSKLEGRGLIRVPEKTCQSLEIRRGELVRVKPVITEESD